MHKMVVTAVTAASLLIFGSTMALAQTAAPSSSWRPGSLVDAVISTLIFGLLGIVLAIVGFKLFDAVIPFALEREICEKQNLAVAILCAAMIIGISLIVAAAVL